MTEPALAVERIPDTAEDVLRRYSLAKATGGTRDASHES
jgi:hypothetical protein